MVLWAFLRRDALIQASYRTGLLFRLVSALVTLLTTWFLSVAVGAGSPALQAWGGHYFAFTTLGVALANPLNVALFGLTLQVRDAQVEGTLEPILVSPLGPARVIAYQTAFELGWACVQSAMLLFAAIALFDIPIHPSGAPLALVGAALGLGIYGALGMISAALTLVFKRGDPAAWLIQQATLLLGGIVFPIEVLPAPLRALAELIPITHALGVVRGSLLLGAGLPDLVRPIAILAVTLAVLGPIAALTLRWALRRAQEDGSLAHY